MRRVWEPTSANEQSNRPADAPGCTDIRYRLDGFHEDVSPREQSASNVDPVYVRAGIEIRAVRSIGLGRLMWIAKRQPWEGKHSVWMALATNAEMRDWLAATLDPATPPTFAQTYGRRTNEKATARHRGRLTL